MSIGEGKRKQELQQSVLHEFSSKLCCSLPAAHWDFRAAMDRRSQEATLTLEVLPTDAAAHVTDCSRATLCEREEEEVSEEEEDAGTNFASQPVDVKHTFIHMGGKDHPPGLPRFNMELAQEPTQAPSLEDAANSTLGAVSEGDAVSSDAAALASFRLNSLRDINVEELMQNEPAPV